MKCLSKYAPFALVIGLAAAVLSPLAIEAQQNQNGIIRGLTLKDGKIQQVNVGLVKSTDMQPTGINAATYGDGSHSQVLTVDAGGRLSAILNTPQIVRDQGGQVFNVMADKYGAKGDGISDDTAAIQAAFTDALAVGGEVFFPPPASSYKITSTINIGGSAGKQQTVSARAPPIQSSHSAGLITYAGASNSSVFVLLGVTDWRFENIGVTVTSGLSNVVIWDQQYSATYPNSGLAKLIKCNTIFSNNVNCQWVRLGQSNGGAASNGYNIKFYDCVVNDNTANSGTIAAQIGGSQNYSPSFYDCTFNCSCNILCGPIASYLTSGVTSGVSTTIPVADTLLFPASGTISIGGVTGAYTSKSTSTGPGNLVLSGTFGGTFGGGSQVSLSVPNQGVYAGNCSFHFHGGELAGNSWGYDVLILCSGYANLNTLQCQCVSPQQRRFLQIGTGVASFPVHVEMKSVTLKNYLPPSTVDSNGVIWLHFNSTLEMTKCSVPNANGTPFSSTGNAWLISNNGATAFGNIRMKDCDFFATVPFVNNTASGVGWPVEYSHVQLLNSSGNVTSALNNDPHISRTITATTYTVTTGNDYTILCNAASNTITPTLPSCAACPAGWTYVFKKTDSSVNAVTVTPSGTDKIDGAATFSLASQYKYVTLRNDGVSNWANVGSN